MLRMLHGTKGAFGNVQSHVGMDGIQSRKPRVPNHRSDVLVIVPNKAFEETNIWTSGRNNAPVKGTLHTGEK